MRESGKTVRSTDAFRGLFAARLDLLIAESGLSHRDWAEMIRCLPSAVSMLRNGLRVPGFERAAVIAEVAEVSLDWLSGASDVRERR